MFVLRAYVGAYVGGAAALFVKDAPEPLPGKQHESVMMRDEPEVADGT